MTIYALASGRGKAGIAVIRVSGPKAGPAIEALTRSYIPPPSTARLRRIVDPETGEEIDRGLVLYFEAPVSYTGENVAEFHVHGGPAVVSALLGALGRVEGLRPAEAGEFTRRAFENERLDLTRAEAIADLINAETEAQRRQAVRQMEGLQGRTYESWRAEILKTLAWIEALIDFPDEGAVEEGSAEVLDNARKRLGRLEAEIAAHLADSGIGERIREGFRVAIIGPPNVGKSSLLNALVHRNAAIVSDIAGTTRDVVEVRLELGGFLMTLSDTAGLRDSDDPIEQEGTRRARAAADRADLVLAVRDVSTYGAPDRAAEIDGGGPWIVWNKVDLLRGEAFKQLSKAGDDGIFVSALTGGGIAALERRLAAFVEAQDLGDAGEAVITRGRHRRALESAAAHLEAALDAPSGDLELMAEDIRRAAHEIGRITGRVDVEDILDVVFRDFCIGK